MIKNKFKDLQKINSNIKDNITNNIKYQGIKKMNNIDNMKIPEKIQKKKNLPELLTKLKARQDSESDNDYRGKSINHTNTQLNTKNPSNIIRKKKSHSLMKKNELVFPKINNNINEYDHFDRKIALHNNHNNNNIPKKKNQKLNIHNKNLNNNINNIALLQGGLLKNENKKDHENDKNEKIFAKIPKYPTNNIGVIKNTHQPKLKSKKKENSNMLTDNVSSLLHPIPGKSNTSNLATNYLYPAANKILLSSTNTNKINNITTMNNSNIDSINNISNLPSSSSSLSSLSSLTTLSSENKNNANSDDSSSFSNKLKELELMKEKLALLQNIVTTLGGISPLTGLGLNTHKTVNITPEIFKNTYKSFEISVTSTPSTIKEGGIIKGYAYNSSMGNVRDYNEDTITATKVTLNNEQNDCFYFFGVYDGHGGKGCSFYLKDNLHKNITEFSSLGIKLAIDKTEEDFKKDEGLNENGEIKDSSGSCGIIAMIKDKKCIIANVGDSRLVIYKNNKISFTTEDHKPGSEIEKKRIEVAGGKIYQTPSLFPLFQNGKEIEIPWRVLPGRLSVSRTFGDIEAKEEKFGGMKGVVVALPDITEIELNEEYNFIVLGCDGIFDVLSNDELLECIQIVLREKKMTEFIDDENVHELCGDFAAMIIKCALAKDSFDNVSCIVIALNLNGLLPIK